MALTYREQATCSLRAQVQQGSATSPEGTLSGSNQGALRTEKTRGRTHKDPAGATQMADTCRDNISPPYASTWYTGALLEHASPRRWPHPRPWDWEHETSHGRGTLQMIKVRDPEPERSPCVTPVYSRGPQQRGPEGQGGGSGPGASNSWRR